MLKIIFNNKNEIPKKENSKTFEGYLKITEPKNFAQFMIKRVKCLKFMMVLDQLLEYYFRG